MPADARDGLCPACLLTAGIETLTGASHDDDAPTRVSTSPPGRRDADAGARLVTGETWGPYRIGRRLGRGGMGEVYEAEHLDSGRRVALKVLRDRFAHPEERARFLREGQLAASVSHPHTVYIFGSEEIGGTPIISMELLAGGTLKDRVAANGPLDPADAVAAVLDIIGGLDAAHAAGILHRDIKPSNCFTDLDGTVKVGDFGLSISTLARDVHHELDTEGFQGTPQFAAPEQLRGEPLDVRADLYAVGATMYWLLTGKPPFEAGDLQTMVTKVTTDPVVSPRVLRPEITARLAAVVVRCLAKNAAERPASYAELADALRPFAPHQESPASPRARVLAGVVDGLVLSGLFTIGAAAVAAMAGTGLASRRWNFLLNAAYFFILEGGWGTSLGKRLFGLSVVSAAGGPASWWQIARRTAVSYLPNLIIASFVSSSIIVVAGNPGNGGALTIDREGIALIAAAVLFVTMRRRNGWAAVHDLLSGTRVVRQPAMTARQFGTAAAPPRVSVTATAAAHQRIGPFVLVSEAGDTDEGRLLIGFDPILRRAVWIHRVRPGTPAVSAARRDVTRIGRLHWLAGRRSATDPNANWDAFEAPDGGPLAASGDWRVVKHRLLDLVNELAAGVRDDSLPPLGVERIWIRADGRPVLIDFAAPGSTRSRIGAKLTPTRLLSAVAAEEASTLRSSPTTPWPISARAVVNGWAAAPPASLEEAAGAVQSAAAAIERVTPARRAIPIALATAPVVFGFIATLVAVPAMQRLANPQNAEVFAWLGALIDPHTDSRVSDPAIRNAVERYVAERYRSVLTDERFWSMTTGQGNLNRLRQTARDILARHPSVSADEMVQLSVTLAPEIEKRRQFSAYVGEGVGSVLPVMSTLFVAAALFVAFVASMFSAIAMPGGIATHTVGLGVVRRDGREIGRVRSLVRVLIVWTPAIAWFVYLVMSPKIQGFVPNPPNPMRGALLVLGTMALGAIWTVVRTTGGPHDFVAGTWVVPR
jgi:eukaryotic-like serine/threonine-protein kinase